MFPSSLECKTQVPSYSSLTNTLAAIWREKKWIPAISR